MTDGIRGGLWRRWLCVGALAGGLVLMPPAWAVDQGWLARVGHVVDGDSLWVRPVVGGARARLRLQGIDAPEICQAGGLDARAALRLLVQGQTLRVTVQARDGFGRAIARVQRQRDGVDIAARMVTLGWAWSEGAGWRRGRYGREEAQARAARRGVFATADAESPAEFRRRHGPCGTARSGAALTPKQL